MVRTQLPAPSFGIDLSRILALSAAIGLHLLALLLLLIPLSHVAPPQAPEKTEPRWQQPVVVPLTPAPAPAQPTLQKDKQPLTQPKMPIAAPVPTQQQAPLVDSSQAPLQATSAEPAAAPVEPLAPPAASEPVAGMQLQYLRAPPPPYPRDALRGGLQGSVLLRVLVGIDGQPLQVSIEKSSGHRILDQAARDQVLKRWKFQAALQQGIPVQAYGLVPVDFSLGH